MRLLQNVVKLWIVKRLYEFVLFVQSVLASPLSLARALLPVRADSFPSSRFARRRSQPLLPTHGNIISFVSRQFAAGTKLNTARRTRGRDSFVHDRSTDSCNWAKRCVFRDVLVPAEDDDERTTTTAYRDAGFMRAMPRRDHRKTSRVVDTYESRVITYTLIQTRDRGHAWFEDREEIDIDAGLLVFSKSRSQCARV